MTPPHLTPIDQTWVDMQNHMEVHRLMSSMQVGEDTVNKVWATNAETPYPEEIPQITECASDAD